MVSEGSPSKKSKFGEIIGDEVFFNKTIMSFNQIIKREKTKNEENLDYILEYKEEVIADFEKEKRVD